MLSSLYYAKNYASIIDTGLTGITQFSFDGFINNLRMVMLANNIIIIIMLPVAATYILSHVG